MAWTNEELRARFREIASLLELSGADRFRVRAYERAADAIGAAPVDIGTLAPDDVAKVHGIGASTARKIAEYLETGRIGMLEELRAAVPPGVVELVRIPGLGPKTALQIHQALGVDSVESLERAIEARALRGLPGLGPKTEENLREGIRRLGAKDTDRLPVADVLGMADELVARLRRLPEVVEVTCAGSLRRMRETVGDIDVLAAATDPDPVTRAFRDSDLVVTVLASGDTKTSVLTVRGLQADLRVVEPDAWGAALVYFTGSKAHNVRVRERAVRRGLTLNEYGLFRRAEPGPGPGEAGADGSAFDARAEDAGDPAAETAERLASRSERDVYAALGLPWIPPTLREDAGEVEAADEGRLPEVVTLDDLRGDLHGHSDWSGDGKVSLEGMVAAAAERGLSYWAATDHAENLSINGISAEGMRRRRDVIAALQERAGIRILDGAELNIDLRGGVDYDEDFLLTFDWCVASVHSLLARGQAEQTERILRAMEHPAVHAIGHPTGRKIGRRPGYEIDLDAVLDKAAETGTALEVNGSPRRLDLGGDLVRRAVRRGVTLVISSDAHALGDFENLRYGVLTAQRGWAQPADVLNTRPVADVLAFAAAKRERCG